ncbi:helix-turn-helix domain-containing protein [Pseudactinotalea sp.]|uniref:AraC family transcriptional regulator n=1 Tax=Pseudactinotalea sp. TaxID=1926260 RepID=UPI003B3A9653
MRRNLLGVEPDPIASRRGILYPARLPTFTRVPAPEPVRPWVRWFWIPEWDIEPGRTSRQQVIAYPASNLVVQHDRTMISGPTTRASHRDLTGRGWAVGALLHPAATVLCMNGPAALVDDERRLEAPDLTSGVHEAMGSADPQTRHAAAIAAFTDWLTRTLPEPSPEALLANRMADLLDGDPTIRTVPQAAAALHVSARTLQRLAHTWVGLPPLAMIRRRRIQEAAETLRAQPETDLATLAADLGYADQAHLANDMRTMLGVTATGYRRDLTDGR